MRVGELLALTPADVNARRCELTISKSYRRYHKSDLITKPKTRKSERTVTLNTSLMRELSSFLRFGGDQSCSLRLSPAAPPA